MYEANVLELERGIIILNRSLFPRKRTINCTKVHSFFKQKPPLKIEITYQGWMDHPHELRFYVNSNSVISG